MHSIKPWILVLAPFVLLRRGHQPCKHPLDKPEQRSASDSSADYTLVWADEFNTNGPPDARNWTFEQGFVRNRELQWYQRENARCENGLLVIEARRAACEELGPRVLRSRSWKRSGRYAEFTSC